ncbi:MAG: hypothetical protein HYS27_26755 [Deltaproteobacteria bacterium]|nr:hypothetical protein [Deltaproteobacteria bacterium]
MPVPVPVPAPRAFGAALLVVTVAACASAPGFRPAAPELGSAVVEAGVGPHVAFGRQDMAVGTSAWVTGQVSDGVSLFVRGSAADFFSYQGDQQPLDDVLASGGGGVRWTARYLPHLVLGAEGSVEYEHRTGPNAEQIVIVTAGMPVAEEAAAGIWAYTNVQLGIAVPLVEDARGPFFGYAEVPLGLAWQPTPWLVVLGEGGLFLPLAGGYGAVAVAFRL